MKPAFSLGWFLVLFIPIAACDGDDADDGAGDAGTAAMEDGDDGDEGSDATGDAAEVDEDAIVDAAAEYQSLQLVSDAPYASQHGLAAQVQVWVPADLVDAYVAAGEGTSPDFGPGALLVKEHLDAEGAHAGLTVMWKGPEGYAPDSADWWWGRIAADGTLAEGGQVGYCVSCHAGASATGFVFGPPSG